MHAERKQAAVLSLLPIVIDRTVTRPIAALLPHAPLPEL